MRIAILTSGILPVPAVQGGAVENLIDFCLDYNERHHLHDITIYSVYDKKVNNHPSRFSKNNHYRYTDISSRLAKILKKIYLRIKGGNEYYHYSVEYFFERVLWHIRLKKYDVIIVENRPGYALKLKGKTNAKFVLHQENDYLNDQTPQFKIIYDAFDLIINTSSYITKRVTTINSNDTKCKTVLNGIDVNRFYNANPIPRQQLGLEEKDFVIVYSGRLTKEKGILELILAIKQLQTPNIKLLIIGANAYGSNQKPTEFIQRLKDESQIINNQVLFTGFVEYLQIPSHLKSADIAIVPSMWEEPFGLTVVEAMAAGLPLITTRSGGIPEICEGVATIVDRKNVVNNLTSAILDLYEHPEKRKRMAEASFERSKLFDKDIYAKNFFKALEGIK